MNTIVIEAAQCPNCGKTMAAGALAGLCPACLLAQGADTQGAHERHRFVPPPIEELQRLFPQLEIVSLLGAGGMGAVYKARQPTLDRWVALKILPAESSAGGKFAERFNREARALARLSHPNIVAVHEFGQLGALHFFIMEFVDGANLRQLEHASRLSPREALQIIPQICDALQYAHDEGVVHRDIKPENVLVDRKGRVKIADFGLAKILGADSAAQRLTLEGQVMGTPHYMAPEQVERPLAVDHRADIYALGVVFYEMLTGDLPLGKFAPPSRKVEVDVRLDDVVLRALENDPARRYQKASEVKSQVETIAGTPPPAPAATTSALNESHVRWMSFPLVVERDGQRHVNKKGALKAFGIIFGASTLLFLLVSLVTGRTHFGWLGISGALSLQVRLLLSAVLVAWGIRRAWHRPATPTLPQTPGGTVILPPPGPSRKALVGAALAPMFFLTALLMFAVPAARGDVTGASRSIQWWQILLNMTVLPLGLAAPFGTTILGWLAVGDIRRSHGRVTGLPLAVFDGLFFPLLAFNALLVWVWMTGVHSVAETTGNPGFTGPWPALARIGAVVICLIATFGITRRVWRAAKRPSSAWPKTAAQRVAFGFAALAAIATGVAVLIVAMNKLKDRKTAVVPSRHVVAEFDSKAGAMVAHLPGRGTVSLLAIAEAGAAENAWWRPDGAAIPDTLFDVRARTNELNPQYKHRDLIVRWRDLPGDASGPSLRIDSTVGGSSTGGVVFRDGKQLSNASHMRVGFPSSTEKVTVWIGFALGLWQTTSTYEANGTSSTHTMLPEYPTLQGQVHQISEEAGQVALTMLLERETRDWNVRVIAMDTNGVEHTFSSGTASGLEKTALWTYKFNLPRAQVKEFQVQLRPVHWVEFRDVPLEPKNRAQLGKSRKPFNPTRFSGVTEVEVNDLFDFDKGKSGVFPIASDGTKSYRGIERNTSWSRSRGYDVDTAINGLRLLQTVVTDVTEAEWETLSPGEVEERLNRGLYAPPQLPSTAGVKLPATYAFRTNDGGVGLLQILSFTDSGTGVKLRYKIIERAHFD